MRSGDLFLSFEGRLDRERWLGAVSLFVAVVVATTVATWLAARAGWIGPAAVRGTRAFVGVGLLVPWLALDWKRFQDLDMPGRWALLCPSLVVAGHVLDLPETAARVRAAGTIRDTLAWVQLALAAWLAYTLACRRGSEGPNRYGADPRNAPLPAGAEG